MKRQQRCEDGCAKVWARRYRRCGHGVREGAGAGVHKVWAWGVRRCAAGVANVWARGLRRCGRGVAKCVDADAAAHPLAKSGMVDFPSLRDRNPTAALGFTLG
eukprot:360863-Chlamydomonas_euryale.AAC.6